MYLHASHCRPQLNVLEMEMHEYEDVYCTIPPLDPRTTRAASTPSDYLAPLDTLKKSSQSSLDYEVMISKEQAQKDGAKPANYLTPITGSKKSSQSSLNYEVMMSKDQVQGDAAKPTNYLTPVTKSTSLELDYEDTIKKEQVRYSLAEAASEYEVMDCGKEVILEHTV